MQHAMAAHALYRQRAGWEKWLEDARVMNRSMLLSKRVVMRAMHAQWAMAYGRWREVAAEMKRAHMIAQRVVARALHRGLAAGWNKWWEDAEEGRRRRRSREVMQHAVAAHALYR